MKARRARSSSADVDALGVRASIVARALGVSVYTVRRWIDTGTMRGVRIGRRWYVSRRAFNAVREALSGV